MPRPGLLALALGSMLLACATTRAPTAAAPSVTPAAPDDQASSVQHPDTPSRKRGVIVPSDVQMSASAPPVPAMPETASPGTAPATGGN
jgi:hypothetical protein